MIDAITASYQAWKLMLVDESGLARDALHIHIGLAVFILTRVAWRWRGGWIAAWLVGLGFALAGEWFDWQGEAARGVTSVTADHIHDLWNTMLWPTMLAVIGPWLEPQRRIKPKSATPSNKPPATEPPSSENAEQPLEQA